MKKKLSNILIILLTLIASSCDNTSEKELSFLTFNVWQEGTSVPNGFNQIRDVILETSPDVICLVEVRNYENEDWTQKLLHSLKIADVTIKIEINSVYTLKNVKNRIRYFGLY